MTDQLRRPQIHPRAPVTLKMVAEAAGVHETTVSRALRRATAAGGRVKERDAKIAELAREMGYTPNPNAASLTTRRSSSFGVLVPELTDVVLATVYDAIEATANRVGFETFVANTHNDPAEQSRRIDLLMGRHVDGLIVGDARLDSCALDRFHDDWIPLVLVSRRYGSLPSVTVDDYRGGYLAGSHLAALGHEAVAIISGPAWTKTGADRTQGCLDALIESGIDPDRTVRIIERGFDIASGQIAAEELFDRGDAPTAVFAASDLTAVGVMGHLYRTGRTPGRDVAVVGFNNTEIGRCYPTPLTTVDTPLAEMGKRGAEMLLAISNGIPVTSTVLPVELLVRESSTGPMISRRKDTFG